MKHLLTIAGSDSGGGAGIQADLKVFSALGTYGMSVITAVTAQNTQQVTDVRELDPEIIEAQIQAVFGDIRVDGVKIGMVGNADAIERIADNLARFRPQPIVIDPVMVAKSGDRLLAGEAVDALVTQLLPLGTLITPNIPEAEVLLGTSITSIEEMEEAARILADRFGTEVLVKGGHLSGEPLDVLSTGRTYPGKRIETRHTHGTGCSLSSAITALIAQGHAVEDAVDHAKRYVSEAIQHAFPIGGGHSPIHHFYTWHTLSEGGTRCD
ncbi:bifunctional hydroxymethylpyrimidine kinase/phosphomethylpyrimidine kinase [Salinithrix halophila]